MTHHNKLCNKHSTIFNLKLFTMKTKTFFLMIISFPFWGFGNFSCSKENNPIDPGPQLPPATQTGANTFGCFINGSLLMPRDGTRGVGVVGSGMIFWIGSPTGTEYRELDIHDYKSERTGSLLLHIQSLDQLGVGNYVIDESNGQRNMDGLNHNYLHCRVFKTATNSYQNYLSYPNSGLLKITRFDFIPSVYLYVSGTFTCKVKNVSNPADEIEITSGRFDINGATLPITVFK